MRNLNLKSKNSLGVSNVLLKSLKSQELSKITIDGLSINVKSFNVESTKINGKDNFIDRGPAIAVLKDGTVILGGSIFVWNEYNQKLKLLGDMISVNERVKGDSRFGITDIAVLYENKHIAKLLI